jgi:hypothetical protein
MAALSVPETLKWNTGHWRRPGSVRTDSWFYILIAIPYVDRLPVVRIAVNPSLEAMGESFCFAHSVQQASDPLGVRAKLSI